MPVLSGYECLKCFSYYTVLIFPVLHALKFFHKLLAALLFRTLSYDFASMSVICIKIDKTLMIYIIWYYYEMMHKTLPVLRHIYGKILMFSCKKFLKCHINRILYY